MQRLSEVPRQPAHPRPACLTKEHCLLLLRQPTRSCSLPMQSQVRLPCCPSPLVVVDERISSTLVVTGSHSLC